MAAMAGDGLPQPRRSAAWTAGSAGTRGEMAAADERGTAVLVTGRWAKQPPRGMVPQEPWRDLDLQPFLFRQVEDLIQQVELIEARQRLQVLPGQLDLDDLVAVEHGLVHAAADSGRPSSPAGGTA